MTTFKRTITRINKNDKKLTEVDIELERDSKKFFRDDDAIELAAALGKNTIVRTLKLQCTSRVRSVGWNAIAELISTSTVLTSIQLTYQFFLFDDLVALLTAVGKNRNITSLAIGAIDLSKVDEQICIGKLLGTIVETTTKLQILDLGSNRLGSVELFHSFLPSLIGNKSINNLNLSNCNLPGTGIIALFQAIRYNNTIQCLNVSGNGRISVSAVAECLKDNTTLQDLLLTNCAIGNVGLELIAKSIQCNNLSSLKNLSLQINCIGDAGAEALAGFVKTSNSIQRLYLYNNCFGTVGGNALAKALYFNSTLVELSLGRNQLDDIAVQNIAKAIRYHPTLTNLSLTSNPITDTGHLSILDSVKYNETLLELKLDEISEQVEKELHYRYKSSNPNHCYHYNKRLNIIWDHMPTTTVGKLRNRPRVAPKVGCLRRNDVTKFLLNDWTSNQGQQQQQQQQQQNKNKRKFEAADHCTSTTSTIIIKQEVVTTGKSIRQNLNDFVLKIYLLVSSQTGYGICLLYNIFRIKKR